MTSDDAVAHRWAAVYAERHRLLRLARRRTLNDAEAEDCVSEAMLRCVEFADLDESRLSAFLTAVTIRLCADQHRERGRLLRAGGRVAGRPDEPSPEDGVCERAEASWLAERVVRLPAHQQRVVEARAEGMSCAAVAGYLDITVDAVKSAVARARGSLLSARDAAYGLLATAAGRYRVVAELAAGGAIVGITVGGLFVAERPEHAPPAVAREQTVVTVRGTTAAPAAPRHDVATPNRAGSRQVVVRPASVVAVTPHVPHPLSTERPVANAGPVKVTNNDNGPIQDRLFECLNYGVETKPTIQCGRPGDH